jgi:hypothetical protein
VGREAALAAAPAKEQGAPAPVGPARYTLSMALDHEHDVPTTSVAAASVATPSAAPLAPLEELPSEVKQALLGLRVMLGLFTAMALLGIGGLALVMGVVEDGEQLEVGLGVGMWVVIAGLSAGLNIVAYRGMVAGSRWAWFLSIFLGVAYTLLTCIPLGAILVLLTIRPEIREHCNTL